MKCLRCGAGPEWIDERTSLLRKPSARAPKGCHCTTRCAAPIVQGRQQPCRDPARAANFARVEALKC